LVPTVQTACHGSTSRKYDAPSKMTGRRRPPSTDVRPPASTTFIVETPAENPDAICI